MKRRLYNDMTTGRQAINEYRENLKKQGKINPFQANIAHLSNKQAKIEQTRISQGDFLHSEVLVIMHAVEKAQINNTDIDILTLIEDIQDTIQSLKAEYQKSHGITTSKKISEEDISKQQNYVREHMPRDLIDKRNTILALYDNIPGKSTLTTEREPCNDCDEMLTERNKVNGNRIDIEYIEPLKGYSRMEIAESLERKSEDYKKTETRKDEDLDALEFFHKYSAQGNKCFQNGQYQEAVENFQTALKVTQNSYFKAPPKDVKKVSQNLRKAQKMISTSLATTTSTSSSSSYSGAVSTSQDSLSTSTAINSLQSTTGHPTASVGNLPIQQPSRQVSSSSSSSTPHSQASLYHNSRNTFFNPNPSAANSAAGRQNLSPKNQPNVPSSFTSGKK